MAFISYIRTIRARGRPVVPLALVLCIYTFAKYNFSLDNIGRPASLNPESLTSNTAAFSGVGQNGEKQTARKEELVFFLIQCEGTPEANQGGKTASDIGRQIRQAAVMLKSAAALTSTFLRFLVIADSKSLYQRLVNTTSNWPIEYQQRLSFEYYDVWYPPGREDMRNMFRVCATERLFLPDMFPDLDAAIYIDTDLVFLRPPEDLWAEFRKFNDKQVAAMAPCLYHYGSTRNKIPFYGSSGLNAGIMHMNLTRLKSFPGGGWTPAVMKVFDNFKQRIKLADQDMLNILFHKHPQKLYELGCEWNYRVWQCSQGGNMCPQAATNGVSILHGNALVFVSGAERKLQAVFDAWERHQLGDSLRGLLTSLQEDLEEVSKKGLQSKCAKISNIDAILTKEFEKHVL
ncbi:glucoside xylosyltransferase 2-like [Penaeus monodon]|uniref:glucoside xylosyltransferase 2-like n=1 Tax=Penaeus monodon TaxID=6687 RepID=UPI0018A70379|nr:glucoside xylosyltransferase 2-like [Penaeus monodon]XP_037783292.1 glucoside xylosyltransferase 2-like [Penaeus monodon]